MTDAPAQQHLRLPVDESAPPERLRWSMLLAVGAAVVLIHLALVTVFTPLAPDAGGNEAVADHSTAFISAQSMMREPLFLKQVDTYDPVSFLHPPEAVGFSFFRANRDDFSLDAPSEPVLLPQKLADLEPLPPFELEQVVRPLVRDVSAMDDDLNAAITAPAVTYPYCVLDSRPDVTLPPITLSTQTERILRRLPPARPSVFELRHTAGVVSPAGDPGLSSPDPRCEAVLTESCGDVELDLAVRAWLDTLLNSQAASLWSPSLGDRFRVVWSARAFGKEPSR